MTCRDLPDSLQVRYSKDNGSCIYTWGAKFSVRLNKARLDALADEGHFLLRFDLCSRMRLDASASSADTQTRRGSERPSEQYTRVEKKTDVQKPVLSPYTGS